MKSLWSLAVAVSLLSITANASAQQPQPPAPDPTDYARPTSCAVRTVVIGGIGDSVAPAELIFVVARPGEGETRARLGRRRLYNVRVYWTEFLPPETRRRPETIILGEGEKVAGFGRLEFYSGGKLLEVMRLMRNADLFIGECYPPDDSYIRKGRFDPCEVKSNQIFYPCRDVKARPAGRRPSPRRRTRAA